LAAHLDIFYAVVGERQGRIRGEAATLHCVLGSAVDLDGRAAGVGACRSTGER